MKYFITFELTSDDGTLLHCQTFAAELDSRFKGNARIRIERAHDQDQGEVPDGQQRPH